MQINDRVFIVTGASSGIGLSTAIALSGRGAKVALLARSTDALQQQIDPTVFDEIFHLDVLGPIVAMQAVIPLLRSQGGGPAASYADGDKPEFVADLVLQAIENGQAQYFRQRSAARNSRHLPLTSGEQSRRASAAPRPWGS
jgi:NAD(P)-dependent dehydrogenase (short-subunit alcohol dehydrogenase family)